MYNKKNLIQAIIKAAKSLVNIFPYFIGIVLLMSIINVSVPRSFYSHIFTKNPILDPLIGAVIYNAPYKSDQKRVEL